MVWLKNEYARAFFIGFGRASLADFLLACNAFFAYYERKRESSLCQLIVLEKDSLFVISKERDCLQISVKRLILKFD